MRRYIDADKAIAAIRAVPEGNWSGEKYVQEIMKVPTADVRENVHGMWIHRKKWDKYVCSKCSFEQDKASKFCPNCGADMRGEQE